MDYVIFICQILSEIYSCPNAVRSGGQEAVGKGNHGESSARKTEEGEGGGGGGGNSDEGGPTSHPRGVVPPSGVVQGGSGPRPATCLSYAQAGHGRAGHTLQPGTPPRETPSWSPSSLLRWRMVSPRRRKLSGR